MLRSVEHHIDLLFRYLFLADKSSFEGVFAMFFQQENSISVLILNNLEIKSVHGNYWAFYLNDDSLEVKVSLQSK